MDESQWVARFPEEKRRLRLLLRPLLSGFIHTACRDIRGDGGRVRNHLFYEIRVKYILQYKLLIIINCYITGTSLVKFISLEWIFDDKYFRN